MTIQKASPAEDLQTTYIPVGEEDLTLWWDFALSIVWLVALIILVLSGNQIPGLAEIRLAFGVIYTFFVPGYWLQAALFPRIKDINMLERVGFSLGLSVGVVPLLALLLDRLPWGLRLWPILIGESGITLIFALAAAFQRVRLGVGQAYFTELHWWPKLRGIVKSRSIRGIYALVAVILALAGVLLAWNFLLPFPDSFMTEFFILGQNRKAENFPRMAQPGETLEVYMGITNKERNANNYRVEVWVQDPWNLDHRICVGTYGPFSLLRAQTIEIPVKLEMPWTGQDMRVDFLLFLDTQPEEPYRALHLFLDVGQLTPFNSLP